MEVPARRSTDRLAVRWPWTVATAFGPIDVGPATDRWRQLWNGRRQATGWADHLNGHRFGRHVFAIPLPEIGDL